MKSLNSFKKVSSFSQDIWKHSRKVTSLFDWAGNSNLIGSIGLDNQMLLYDIRLSRPVFSKFINAPFQNSLKTYDDKLAIAPKNSEAFLQVFDMRKFDQCYSSLISKSMSIESCNYIIDCMKKKFDGKTTPFNLKFYDKSLKNKFLIKKKSNKFVDLVVNLKKNNNERITQKAKTGMNLICHKI